MVLLMLLVLIAVVFTSDGASAWTNPADELADLINNNRTGSKVPALADNPGLACLALQYVHEFRQECDKVGKEERPQETLLASTFADKCGVTRTSVLTPLSGSLVFCQSSYVKPPVAFNFLMSSSQSLPVISNPNHTQFGVAIGSYDGGSPFYWVTLFSDSPNPNSTFVFADTGKTLVQHEGCFSGTGEPCNESPLALLRSSLSLVFLLASTTLASFLLAQ